WTNPDEDYEKAVQLFAARALQTAPFLDDFVPFVRQVAQAARRTSLAQTALKLASPGVTDVYQGCELWDLSLVDPDNRREVDFERRFKMLNDISNRLGERSGARLQLAREVAQPAALLDGRAKMLLLREGLHHRREHGHLYLEGDYEPLAAE